MEILIHAVVIKKTKFLKQLQHMVCPKLLPYARFLASKRRAAILERIPKWLTDEDWLEITEIYKNCPKGYEVDHRIPLQGEKVSGLHLPKNLQYLPIEENRSKNNFFIPVVKQRDSFMY